MASNPPTSTLADRYQEQMARISSILDELLGINTSATPTPSATFTSGPNRGLPVAAMPPSATPFRQKSGPRRSSKVTSETRAARTARAERPAKLAERFARNAPKPPALLARDTQPTAKTKPSARLAPYSTRSRAPEPAAPIGKLETRPAPRRQPVAPSALSQTLGRINAAPASSIYRSAPGLTAEDFRQAQETIDLGQTQRAFDIGYATQARQLADEDIARTQAGYAAGDEAFRQRMAELDADAYAKHMAAQRAGRRAATATGRASQAADAMGNQYFFDPLAAFGRAMGFGQ